MIVTIVAQMLADPNLYRDGVHDAVESAALKDFSGSAMTPVRARGEGWSPAERSIWTLRRQPDARTLIR